MGLVDEYQERWLGYHTDEIGGLVQATHFSDPRQASFSCRSLGPTDSIMSDQNEAVVSSIALEKNRPGELRSLLRPAYFRALTQPGCSSVNRIY
jgi:hypothetical protein